jgi:hypothetical protein
MGARTAFVGSESHPQTELLFQESMNKLLADHGRLQFPRTEAHLGRTPGHNQPYAAEVRVSGHIRGPALLPSGEQIAPFSLDHFEIYLEAAG